MPDPVGGIVWFGWDNPAMTAFVPLYCGIGDLPDSWKLSGRQAFDRECAWWAFNRVADLSAQKWGEMRVDVDSVRTLFEDEAFLVELEKRFKGRLTFKSDPSRHVEFFAIINA